MPDTATLASALAAFQAEMPRIPKDAAAVVQGEKDGRKYTYGYKYADLATITAIVAPLLGRHGLSFTSTPTLSDNGFVLRYRLRHASGEADEGTYPLPDPIRTKPQSVGSMITYARRYCLCAATGVHPDDEDDDGQAAATAPQAEAVARGQQQRPPEVDEHGAATFAEQERMRAGPVPGTRRLAATPADDEFYDPGAPEADGAPAEDRRGSASVQQLRALHAGLGRIGVSDDGRHSWLSDTLGVPVRSAKDLSFTQAARCLQVVNEAAKKVSADG